MYLQTMVKLGIRKGNTTNTHMVLCSIRARADSSPDYSLDYCRFIFEITLVEN